MIGSSESLSTVGELVALRFSFWRELDSSSEMPVFPLSLCEDCSPRPDVFELSDLLNFDGALSNTTCTSDRAPRFR
jgi:hypothetical protein